MPTINPAVTFPVKAGSAFETSTAYSGTFIPALWSKKLNVKFFASTMLPSISNTSWEGEIKNQGDTIRIRTAPTISISDYESGMTLATEVPEPIYDDLQINKGKYFQVAVNDVLAHQADMSLMNMFTEDAAKQLKIEIENECFYQWFVTEGCANANKGANAGLKSAAYGLGIDTMPIDESDPDKVLNAILGMSSVLDEQNVPESGRWLMISPRERNLLMQSSIAQAYFTGDQSSVIRTGKIGMLDRFEVYVSNILPRGAAGKNWNDGQNRVTPANLTDAKARRMMVAGTKDACTFAAQINKTESLRNQTDFGDLVRGLAVYGRKVLAPKAMTIAVVGSTT